MMIKSPLLCLASGSTILLFSVVLFAGIDTLQSGRNLPRTNTNADQAISQPVQSQKIQTDTSSQPVRIVRRGKVLNGQAVEKKSPKYPKAARKAGVQGQVIVSLTIDTKGRVIKAEAVSGPPTLYQAALDAAYKWRFTPTLLEGEPVIVTGSIVFNFVM